MIRAGLGFPAASPVARSRRQKATESSAATRAAASAGTGKPSLEPAVRAFRAATGLDTHARRSATPAGSARSAPRRRADCRSGRAAKRGRAAGFGLRSGSAPVRPRELRSSPDSVRRPSAARLGGPGDSAERTTERTGAGKAVATPVFTCGGSGSSASTRGGVGTGTACATGAAAGTGSAAGTGCSPVEGGLTGACSDTGRNSSGSRYPFGSELRRTPR
jgi:hypothetical protein